MIDLHSHVVPAVDDGAASMTEAIKMLRMAESDGIETIVATPHVFSSHDLEKDPELIFRKVEIFLKEVGQSNLKIRVLPGAEVFFTTNLLQYFKEYQCLLTLNASDYFLLEFPFDFIFPGIKEFIYRVLMEGWIPIIAHAERNQLIQRKPEILYEMVKLGVLAQINAGSLKGDFGEVVQATAFQLLHYNLVHVIASDAHSPKFRVPRLSFVPDLLRDAGVEEPELLIQEIPRAIIDNRGIPDIGSPRNPRRTIKFFDFIKGKFR
jgi:protein-tyrosine phosphatase